MNPRVIEEYRKARRLHVTGAYAYQAPASYDAPAELARILREAARRIEANGFIAHPSYGHSVLSDTNGNTVGFFVVKP